MLVRPTFCRKPGRKTRVMARPVWSGPSENRKVAGTSAAHSSASRLGTPSRVPRSVSTSILRASRVDIGGCGRSLERVILVREVVVERQADGGLEVDLGVPAELL